jgi:hypothetical protein
MSAGTEVFLTHVPRCRDTACLASAARPDAPHLDLLIHRVDDGGLRVSPGGRGLEPAQRHANPRGASAGAVQQQRQAVRVAADHEEHWRGFR